MGTDRQRWMNRTVLFAAASLLLVACSGGSDDAADPSPGTDDSSLDSGSSPATADSSLETSGSSVAVSSTVALESRPVPTVPPSTIQGQVGTTLPGVVNASPTIVPPPPDPVDPDAPASSQAPPSTELVGDPQPNPDTTSAPPPPTVEPPPSACERLEAFDIVSVVTDATGSAASAASVSNTVCRYTAGSVVVEVHFVARSTVTDDWYKRSGVEPVGEVGGDAVGFSSFMAPGEASAAGYTIALAGGNQGVIVAVRGTGDGRFVAGQVAIFANQAA